MFLSFIKNRSESDSNDIVHDSVIIVIVVL